jgi:hypothetical protein
MYVNKRLYNYLYSLILLLECLLQMWYNLTRDIPIMLGVCLYLSLL